MLFLLLYSIYHKMFFGGEPNCAKLFSRIKELDKDYANNIENICARDLLSDTLGLTVVFPDDAFRKEFNALTNSSTPNIDDLTKARRMLQNTIIKKNLKTAKDYTQFTHSLPLRSGLTLQATDTQGDDTVMLEGGITLKKDTKFESPNLFNYSLWKVESGNYPTIPYFRPKREKTKTSGGSTYEAQGAFIEEEPTRVVPFDEHYADGQNYDIPMSNVNALTFQGGAKDQYVIQVGRLLKDSPDTLRVSVMASILTEYKIELLRDRCSRRNPLLVKAASLYNWLSLYNPQVLNVVLPITDIHPGINLMLLILDPLSPVTIEMLLGTGNNTDSVQVADGWRGCELTDNAYEDWANYLKKASSMVSGEAVLAASNTYRNTISQNTSLDYASAVSLVNNMYNSVSKEGSLNGATVIPNATITAMYAGDKYKDRKMWQDQLRFVSTCAFSGSCDGNIVSGTDIDDELSQAVRFRPMQGYTSACTFTVLQGNYSSKDDYYAFLKWLYSTDLMYVPQSLDSRMCTSTSAPYNGVEYGKVSRTQILNNDYIKAQMVNSMKGTSKRSAALAYAMAWAGRSGTGAVPTAPMATPVGGENIQDPINLGKLRSMQDLANDRAISNYAPGKQSDDFIYGDSQLGQANEPGMYGSTYGFPKGRDVPFENWGIGGNARPSGHLNTPYQDAMPRGSFNNLVVSQ